MISRGVETPISMGGPKLLRIPESWKHTDGMSGIWNFLRAVRTWINVQRISRTSPKRLRVSETVSLGEKRFVAVIHVDGLQFLVGGGATNMALLAQLNAPARFCDSIDQAIKSSAPVPKRRKRPVAKTAVDQGREIA